MNYGRSGLGLVGLLTAAASVSMPFVNKSVRADDYQTRTDKLCDGAYGELGCEKTICTNGGPSLCTAQYCNAENCGGGGGC